MEIKNALIIAIVLYGAYWFITHWGKKVPMSSVPPLDTETPSEKVQRMMREDKINRDKFAQDKANKAQQDAANKAAEDAVRRASGQSFDEAVKNAAKSKAPKGSTVVKPQKSIPPPTPDTTSKQPVQPQDNTLGKGALDAINGVVKSAGKVGNDFLKAVSEQTQKTLTDPAGQVWKLITDPITGEKKYVPIEAVGFAGIKLDDGDTGIAIITIITALAVIFYSNYKLKHRKKRR